MKAVQLLRVPSTAETAEGSYTRQLLLITRQIFMLLWQKISQCAVASACSHFRYSCNVVVLSVELEPISQFSLRKHDRHRQVIVFRLFRDDSGCILSNCLVHHHGGLKVRDSSINKVASDQCREEREPCHLSGHVTSIDPLLLPQPADHKLSFF